MWARGTFFRCLRKVHPAHSCSACVVQELGWLHTKTISKILQIFLFSPNFLLTHRNRYSEETDDGQKLNVDTLIIIPTLKIYMFWYSGWTDGDINPGGLS
jgi:hypothetical protein